MRKLLFNKKGVSLAELIACIIVLALVMTLAAMVSHNINTNFKNVENQWTIQQEIKHVMDSLLRDSASGSLSTSNTVDLLYEDFDSMAADGDGWKTLTCCAKTIEDSKPDGTVETKNFGRFKELNDAEHTLEFEVGDPECIYFFNYNNLFYILNRGEMKAVPFKLYDEIKLNVEFSIATTPSEIGERDADNPAKNYEDEIKDLSGKTYVPNCLTVTIKSDEEYLPSKYSMTSSYSLRNMREGQYINVTGNYYSSPAVAGWTASHQNDDGSDSGFSDGVYSKTTENGDLSITQNAFDEAGKTYSYKNKPANVVRYTSVSAYFGQVDAGGGTSSSQATCGTRWLMMNQKFSEPVIDTLHDFRDNVLKGNAIGDFIIEKYYDWSPAVIKAAESNEYVEKILRWFVIHFAMMLD